MRHPRLRELFLLTLAAAVLAIGWVQLGDVATVAFFAYLGAFAVMHLGVRVLAPRADPILLPVAALLVAVGFIQLSAIDRAQLDVGASWATLAPLQGAWLGVSTVGFLAVLYIFRTGLGPAWRVQYTLALLGIVAIFSPLLPWIGTSIRGARLWLRLGPLSFQPGEVAKIFLVLFLAAYLAERRELLTLPTRRLGPIRVPDPRYLAPLLGIIGLALLLFLQQNDLGSPLLFFLTFMAILWIATGKAFYPLVGIGLFAGGVYVALQFFPHVARRFQAWLNPWADPEHSGYQIIQGMYGMAEGGIGGVGLVGPDTQPQLVPFAWTDLIFGSIGHTLGLAGVMAVVMAFVLLLTRAFYIGLRSSSDLHALAAAGFGVAIGIQTAVIMGGVLRLLPLTGITLPFVSYGGSSLLANFAILACLMAVSNAESTTQASPTVDAAEPEGVRV